MRKFVALFFYVLILKALPTLAQQQDLRIPLNESLSAPAIDLIDPTTRQSVDQDMLFEQIKKGHDTRFYEPQITDLYQATPQVGTGIESVVFPENDSTLQFQQELTHASGLFRARVSAPSLPNTYFQMLFSLDTHAALARNALLRKLGYNIPSPKYYPKLNLTFQSIEQRDSFLNHLADETLTSRNRWVVHPDVSINQENLTLTFQDVCLEPALIAVPQFHWGILTESVIQSRRSIRALIVPLTLLDLPESVNMFAFEAAKISSENLVLSRPNAARFQNETSIGDVHWIVQKIAKLTREDWKGIIQAGKYPEDIEALILEKTLARVNHLEKLLHLKKYNTFKVDPNLTLGHVINGKATQENYEGYALRFAYGDPQSPLRPSEVSRFLSLEVINSGLNAALTKANSYLQILKTDQYLSQHKDKLFKQIEDHLKNNPNTPFVQPIGAWGGPTAGFNVGVSRNIMTGTYYGSDSQVQLVDTFSVSMNVGGFFALTGIPYMGVSNTTQLQIQRTYIHVKPIGSIKAGLRTNWLDIAVPHFMLKLSKLLTQPDAKPETFLDELKPGEMLLVNDALIAANSTQVNIPITALMGIVTPIGKVEITPSISLQQTTLSRTTFYRDQDNLQVYLGKIRSGAFEGRLDATFFVKLFTLAASKNWGSAHTLAFVLPNQFENEQKEKQFKAAVRTLLRRNNSDPLTNEFSAYDLQHKANGKKIQFSLGPFSWVKRENFHRLEITPPKTQDDPKPEDYKRTVLEGTLTKIRGTNVFGFMGDLINAVVPYVNIGNSSHGDDPSAAFLGKSKGLNINSEIEITPGYNNQLTSVLRESYNGWSLNHDKLIKLIQKIKEKVGTSVVLDELDNQQLIDETAFTQTKKVQAYSITWTLILYEKGLSKIYQLLDQKQVPTKAALQSMVNLVGLENFKDWCKDHQLIPTYLNTSNDEQIQESSGQISETINGVKTRFGCAMPWMETVFDYRNKLSKKVDLLHEGLTSENSALDKIKFTNRMLEKLEQSMSLSLLIQWVGKENAFFQARISGFRTHDENGDSEYFSNTIGKPDSELVTGPISSLRSSTKIIDHELSARYLSSGF